MIYFYRYKSYVIGTLHITVIDSPVLGEANKNLQILEYNNNAENITLSSNIILLNKFF